MTSGLPFPRVWPVKEGRGRKWSPPMRLTGAPTFSRPQLQRGPAQSSACSRSEADTPPAGGPGRLVLMHQW